MRHPATTRPQSPDLNILQPLLAEDAPSVAAQRAMTLPYRGLPMTRESYDAMMAAVPPAADVRLEPGTVGGVSGWWCRPEGARPGARLLYLHGGGYMLGSAQAYRHLASQFARRVRADTFVPDYRLAPEHRYPAGVHDAWDALQWVLEHAADLDAQPQDVGAQGLDPLQVSGAVGVEQDQRVHVAVAGVEHVGGLEPVAVGDLADAAQHLVHLERGPGEIGNLNLVFLLKDEDGRGSLHQASAAIRPDDGRGAAYDSRPGTP